MKVSVICPLYNGEKYIRDLHKNILRQEKYDNEEVEMTYVLTKTKDSTQQILDEIKANYLVISSEEFSHSCTREMMAYKSTGDIIVFISQDVIMKNEFWLKNLIKPIIEDEAEASFSRQLCTNNTIEKYIRAKNYPKESRVVDKKDVSKYGLMTFFYSDASSCIKSNLYKELKGYDGRNLIINEDMYLAHKLILNGNRIKYCADSEVYHSHVFTLKQLFNRYFDTGVFLSENKEFQKYSGNSSGVVLAKYVFKEAFKDGNISVLLNIIPNFAARLIGSKLGSKYKKLSKRTLIKCSLNKKYWASEA